MVKLNGASEILSLKEFTRYIKEKKKKIAYLPPPAKIIQPYGFYANPARKNLENKLVRSGLVKSDLKDARREIARIRQVKEEVEIDCIKKAIEATKYGLMQAKSIINTAENEIDLERAAAAEFYGRADGHAYTPIVASGANAATIHHRDNYTPLKKNQLILFDTGAKYHGYASDVSRTYARGKPTKRMLEIYDAVSEIHEYALSILRPGISIKDFHDTVCEKYREFTAKLGVNFYPEGFPHLVGHYLGLDIHDAGDYFTPLTPGCVLTVEPGIYLPDEGIGVRIEDDVLITKDGIENLTESIPKML